MDFIELLKVVFLGIVEGITEWLPISSTGHLILVEEFVKLDVSKQFWEMFMVVIQLGAILAVVVLYWNKIWPFRNKKPQHVNVTKIEKTAGFICRFVKIDKMVMWFKILVSCLPAILIGLPFDNFIEKTFNNWFVVSVILIGLVVIFCAPLIKIFNDDPGVVEYGVMFIRLISPFYLIICFNQIYAGALRGAGDAKAPMVIMLFSFVLFRQLYLAIGTQFINTEWFVGLGYPAGWIMCSTLQLLYYYKSKWRDRCRANWAAEDAAKELKKA